MSFGHCSHGPASPPPHHKNYMIWMDLSLMTPLSCLWLLLTWSSLPSLLSREPSDQCGFNSGIPPKEFPLRVICRTVYAYIYIFCSLFLFLFAVDWIFLFSDYCHCCILIQKMYSRYFHPQIGYIIYIFESIKIIHRKTRLLSIGCRKDLLAL